LIQFRPAVVATVIMAAVVLLFKVEWSSFVAGQIAARLTVSVLVGAIGYGTALWFLGGPVRSEIIEVAGWVMRGRRAVGTSLSSARAPVQRPLSCSSTRLPRSKA